MQKIPLPSHSAHRVSSKAPYEVDQYDQCLGVELRSAQSSDRHLLEGFDLAQRLSRAYQSIRAPTICLIRFSCVVVVAHKCDIQRGMALQRLDEGVKEVLMVAISNLSMR